MSGVQIPGGKFAPSIQPNPDISRLVQNKSYNKVNPSEVSFSHALQSRMNQAPQTAPQPQYQIQQPQTPLPQVIPIPESMPANVASGQELENIIVNNMQKYKQSGTQQITQTQAQPMHVAGQPTMYTAMQNAQSAAGYQPQSQSLYNQMATTPKTEPITAMNSVFARGFSQPNPISSETIPQQRVQVSAPELQITPEEAAQLDAIIAAQPVQQSQSTNRQTTRLYQQSNQQDMMQQSNGSSKKKGFFGAMGSFFKNIASGLTLGFYRPDNEPSPQGISRVIEPFKKIFWDAPKSLFVDAPVGAYNDIRNAVSGNDKDYSVAMNNMSNINTETMQKVIEAGEKTIANRRVKPFAMSGASSFQRRFS